MMVRLTLDGASKCDLRDFLLEEWVAVGEVSGKTFTEESHAIVDGRVLHYCNSTRTGVDFGHLGG